MTQKKNKTARLQVALSPEEKTELENLASWKGRELGIEMGVSAYIRWIIQEQRKEANKGKQDRFPGI